jgi:hypothetical protein
VGKINIVGKLRKKVCINGTIIEVNNSVNDLSEDFIIELLADSKSEIGYESDKKIKVHSKDFDDEIVRYGKRRLKFNKKEFEVVLSRKTYGGTVLIECSIEYDGDEKLFGSVYDFKIKIKEWLDKYCKPIYWIHDENNIEICTEAYKSIHNAENKFRQILSLFMMRKCGDIYLNKKLEEEFNRYSDFYKKSSYTDFKNINSKLYNIGFSNLPKLLDMKITQVIVEEEKCIKEMIDEVINLLDNIGDITYAYKEIEKQKSKLNSEILKINREECIFNTEILSILDDNFKFKWGTLSGMRNMVMHNKPICKKLYDDINRLCNEIGEKFKICLDDLESCFYTEEEFIYDCLCDENAERQQYYLEFIDQERENLGIQFQLSEEYVMDELSEHHQEIRELMSVLDEIHELSLNMENIYGDIDEIREYLKGIEEKKFIKQLSDLCDKLGIQINIEEFNILEGIEDIVDLFIYKMVNNSNIEDLYDNLVEKTKIDREFSIDKIAVFVDCEGAEYNLYIQGELNPEDEGTDFLECIIYKNEEILRKAYIEVNYGNYSDQSEGYINCEQILHLVNEEIIPIYENMKNKIILISDNVEKTMELLNIR